MNRKTFNKEIKKIYNKLSKIPETNEETSYANNVLSDYANKLNNIAEKMNNDNNIVNRNLSDLLNDFLKTLYKIIDDISILLSKKKYIKYKYWLKNKKYNNWWIPIINHIRVIFHIFTKKDRIIHSGILLIFIGICLFFINITK